MLQFKFLTDRDRKEAAGIERRRQFEEERKKRIFNAKNRRIGVDLSALEQQIEEKKRLEQEKKNLEAEYDKQRVQNDRLALLLAKKEEEERKRIEIEVNQFRKIYQRIEDRREYDIYDPDALKKDMSARIKDDDPRLGLASCQRFAGEDLTKDERKKLLIDQQRAFLQQQIEERESADRDRKKAEEAYYAALNAREDRAIQLEELEKECKRKLQIATERFNKALAEEHNARKQEEMRQDFEDKQAEMYNTLMSDMMTENPDVSRSNLGENRCIGYMYRGMTDDQRKAIREFQKNQAAEREKRRLEQEQFDKDWEKYTLGVVKTAENIERENQRKKRDLEARIAAENKRLADEQKAHLDYLNRIVYSNRPTAAFFEQFNTSTR